MRECVFNKGQSKRIWNELYKVSEMNFTKEYSYASGCQDKSFSL